MVVYQVSMIQQLGLDHISLKKRAHSQTLVDASDVSVALSLGQLACLGPRFNCEPTGDAWCQWT